MNKKIIWGIMVIAVLVGGFYIFDGLQFRTDENMPSPNISLQTNTSNWKTYTNTEYGFEISYPGDPIESLVTDVSEYELRFSTEKSEETFIVTMTPINKFLPVGPGAVFYDKRTKEMVTYQSVFKEIETYRQKSSINKNGWSGFMVAEDLFIPNEKSGFIIGLQIAGMDAGFSSKIVDSFKFIQ